MMRCFDEYLRREMSPEEMFRERKRQLAKISKIRGRDILSIASEIEAPKHNSINYEDLLPVEDLLHSDNRSESLDVILETPGGDGITVNKLVQLIRERYETFEVIVPGMAMSAGTIFAMGADEIHLGPVSSLGPIDAQLPMRGMQVSADAFLKELEKIREESNAKGSLDLIYIPILQNIRLGEIEMVRDARAFATELVEEWLAKYRFKDWTHHSTSGEDVTDAERRERAKDIAHQLCDHKRWKSHGRSLGIPELRSLKLKVKDFSEDGELADAIHRYYTLLRLSFHSTPIVKVYETTDGSIYRSGNLNVGQAKPKKQTPSTGQFAYDCPKCGAKTHVQCDFLPNQPLAPGHVRYPANDMLPCPQCEHLMNVVNGREQLEKMTGKKALR